MKSIITWFVDNSVAANLLMWVFIVGGLISIYTVHKEQFPNVDGVVSFVHGTGCGMAADGEGFEAFQRVQWGYAGHPNLAGVVLVGLGCEVFQIPRLMDEYGLEESETFRPMTIQGQGGTRKTIDRGLGVIREMLPRANEAIISSRMMFTIRSTSRW